MPRARVNTRFHPQPKSSDYLSEEAKAAIAAAKVKPRQYPRGATNMIHFFYWEDGYLKMPRGSAACAAMLSAYAKVRIDIAGGYTLEEVKERHGHLRQLDSFLNGVKELEPDLWQRLGTQSKA